MFSAIKMKKEKWAEIPCGKNEIVAPVNGKMIPITEISDPVFSTKLMGDGIAFYLNDDQVTICSPANGNLCTLFPTGHAFGIVMENGVELLIHIGIDTVNANGRGFDPLCPQGKDVRAGEPIVNVDVKKLKSRYEMPVMLIVTEQNGKEVCFKDYTFYERGMLIASIIE